jgi:integrase
MSNFLSESDFELFLDSLRLMLESNQRSLRKYGKDLSMPIEGFIELFRLTYGSALRISETLNIYPGDIDFDRRIITLNQTKTGFKKCRKCKGLGCEKCDNLGKIRKPQRTTIHPNYSYSLRSYFKGKDQTKPLFSTNRITLWDYAKKAGRLVAGLDVFEQQDERLIQGVWTHLFRKSRAQQMMIDGKEAGEDSDFVYELVKVKLRHSSKGRDVTIRYTNKIGQKLGLNDLLEWEKKHYETKT